MKREHLKIELLMYALLTVKHEKDFSELIKAVHKECKQRFLRLEIFYERTFYQEKVYESQRAIEQHAEAREYELAALKRDSRILYELKIQEIDKYFQGQFAPAFNIDGNGLIRCLFDFHKHERLIAGIATISKI